jgi:two-component system chemotaxis sensor kinase CheA
VGRDWQVSSGVLTYSDSDGGSGRRIAPPPDGFGGDKGVKFSAELALKLKEEGRTFDLILSDIQMPGMDGRSFATLVKKDPQWKGTPVVGLAADNDSSERAPFDSLARKFDREELMSTIRSHLDSEAQAA